MTNIQAQIEILVALQRVEMKIRETDRQIDALAGAAKALDQAAGEKEGLVDDAQNELNALKKEYRELESESKINAQMIVKSNEKLRSVKTNKEYQSILKEIEEIRKRNSAIEDRMLEELERIEAQEAAVNDAVAQHKGFLSTSAAEKTALAEKAAQQRQAVDAMRAEGDEIRARADEKTIAVLEDVKSKVRGMSVVPVQQAVCMGCHMNIPAQLYNELLRFDELRFCPHCNRIIYWKEKDSE